MKDKDLNDLWARLASGKPPTEKQLETKERVEPNAYQVLGPLYKDPYEDEAVVIFIGRQVCTNCNSTTLYQKADGPKVSRVRTVNNKFSRIYEDINMEEAYRKGEKLGIKAKYWDEKVNGCPVCLEELIEGEEG